ncbi:MAG: ECF-type sigma factor [Bryobacteraceae bacterium]
MGPDGEITRLISDWQRGAPGAENALFNALYQRLHTLALQCLRGERPDRAPGATSLVHEAYLRFRQTQNLEIANSAHLLALAAQVMRRILVDRARARHSAKRGGDVAPVEISDALMVQESEAEQILAVDFALEDLARYSPRKAQLVELRYFAGFSEEESAACLDISVRTVRREWQIAKTRLRMAIDGHPAA